MHRSTTAVVALVITLATTLGAAGASAESARGHPQRPQRSDPNLLVTSLAGVDGARQVVSVTASRYGSVHATVQAFARTGTGWVRTAGPWSAWIGRNGFARPDRKREGDGKTPTGSFRFSFFFGAANKPKVRFPWRHAAPYDYWDDDPASPRYNTWVDTRYHSAGRNPEALHVRPSYDDVAVIAYNTSRIPGRGSAIFLHLTHHSPTSGCVALPRSVVLGLLHWLNPRDHPRIIMGRTATVTR
jgi:L,D-peptidoglycan transpeptidase YkuD (ErfK/YbiS/YcfS/YnhG family)